jgi:hypothetical protein
MRIFVHAHPERLAILRFCSAHVCGWTTDGAPFVTPSWPAVQRCPGHQGGESGAPLSAAEREEAELQEALAASVREQEAVWERLEAQAPRAPPAASGAEAADMADVPESGRRPTPSPKHCAVIPSARPEPPRA